MASSRNEDGPDVRVRHEGHVKNCDKIIGKQQQFPAADLFFSFLNVCSSKFFIAQVIFVFLLFLVLYANEVETKEK